MSDQKLVSGPSLSSYFERVSPELGATNAGRLDQFLQVEPEEDSRYRLDKVFSKLFPGQEKTKAQESFKKFRKVVNEAAEEAECSLRVFVDRSRSGDLAKRFCWFEIDPSDNPELLRYANTSSDQGGISSGDQKSQGLVPGPVYKIFISYAHKNRKLAEQLLEAISKRLQLRTMTRKYNVEIWIDRNIEPGKQWRQEIENALKHSKLGLFLLSVDFLQSDFIQKTEVPAFLDDLRDQIEEKHAIPVMLCDFPIEGYIDSLGEIAAHQIFRYLHDNDKFYAWNKLHGDAMRDVFGEEFASKIVSRLDEIHERSSLTPYDNTGHSGDNLEEAEKCGYAGHAARFDSGFDPKFVEKNRGREGTMHDLNRVDDPSTSGKEVVAVNYLMTWAKSQPGPLTEFMAVLGEFGIGKTTSLHHFAQELIEARREDPNLPLPLLFDLRFYSPGDHPISLKAVLSACIAGTKSEDGEEWNLDPDKLIHAVRHEGAIAIYDGLDEVMNGLTAKERQTFIKELWSILPPLRLNDDTEGPMPFPKGRGRIIMSCRSHFFRDVFEQNGIYTGNEREGIQESDRRMLLILPFNEEQIRSYLKSCLGEEHGEKVFALLTEIHNLIDLAKRPLLANMIREIVPDLEAMMMEGKDVQGVDLYDRFIRKHLERDDGKHVFSKEHKLRLMEGLAADLWISRSREWEWSKLEEWLDEFLGENPAIANRYNQPPEVLNQDFRNSTAVVRRAGEKSDFRFAHTSLQEYFLARWMHRALEKGQLKKFSQLPVPSDETLIFLGQLFAKDDSPVALERLAEWMESPNGETNLIGFRYMIISSGTSYPVPNPAKLPLQNANIYRWKIRGIKFRGLDLSGAQLAETTWEDIQIESGSLNDATVIQSAWKNCQLSNVKAENTRAGGATFRECLFEKTPSFTNAWYIECTGGEILNTSGNIPTALMTTIRNGHSNTVMSVSCDEARGRYLSASDDQTLKVWDAETFQCLATLEGHSNFVRSVSCDEARGRYLSASLDQTLKVWDAETFQCLATLEGHSNFVMSVSCDEARGRYLSASLDQTLKVWDAETFQCLATLEGHSNSVWSVSCDEARGRYLSASLDQTLKVWDAETFQCLATLEGHSNTVTSVSCDEARGRYLSASDDQTLKVWDAETFQCLATLEGHSNTVMSVSCDEDRGRYLSASSDKTVKVWDAETFQCLATLEGHSNTVMSVSCDEARGCYLSASYDQTLKVWDAETFQCLATLEGHSNWVLSVSCDEARGRYLSASSDQSLNVWDAETFQCLATLEGHSNWVLSVSCDEARGRYLSASSDKTVKVWDAETFQCLATLEGHSNFVMSVSCDEARGRYLSASSDKTVKVWDAETFQCLATLEGHSNYVWSVSCDEARGCYLSASYDQTLKVWDAETFQCLATLEGHSNWVLSVSCDEARGRYLSASSDKTLKVWDVETFQCLATLEGHSNTVMSVSCDETRGRYLSASYDNTLNVWDAETFQCLATLEGNSNSVWSVSCDEARGRYLSASLDQTVKVWDAETFQCLATITHLPDFEWAVVEDEHMPPIAMSPRAAEHLMWVGREAASPHRLIALPFEGLQ